MRFGVSYDVSAWIITLAVGAVLVVVAMATGSLLAWLPLLILLIGYGYSPRGYIVLGRSIVVRRLFRDAEVPLEGLREVRRAEKDDFRGCIRLWGSGGLFGYYGIFRTSRLGKSTWYVTNRGKTVVVATSAKTVVLSPDDVDGFLKLVRGEHPGAGLDVARQKPYSPDYTPWGVPVSAIFTVVVLGLVLLALLYSPGPPRYTLTSSTLTIHDRFYPVTVYAGTVDVDRIRIVDIEEDPEWRPTRRTNGFGNLRYRAGWFRVAGGQTVRMYRAGGRRLVLLPPEGDGAAVLVEVDEPEKFIEELQQRWAQPSSSRTASAMRSTHLSTAAWDGASTITRSSASVPE